MTIEKWLKQTQKKLEDAGIGTARLDALVLLEDATDHDRAYLLSHPTISVIGQSYHKLEEKIKRRVGHEPLAYIRGKTEFYKREFIINKSVLEPRPESETMIDNLKKIVIGLSYHIIDVGTGSGALAVTVKLELPDVEVIATDIDPNCLKVAKKNAKKHSTEIEFYQGDLLEPVPAKIFDTPTILLCNLPYVPDDFTINQAAMNEPKIAIFGGPDGLDIYRKLFLQIAPLSSGKLQFDRRPKYILTESLPFQHKKLESIAKKAGYRLQKTNDFIQVFML